MYARSTSRRNWQPWDGPGRSKSQRGSLATCSGASQHSFGKHCDFATGLFLPSTPTVGHLNERLKTKCRNTSAGVLGSREKFFSPGCSAYVRELRLFAKYDSRLPEAPNGIGWIQKHSSHSLIDFNLLERRAIPTVKLRFSTFFTRMYSIEVPLGALMIRGAASTFWNRMLELEGMLSYCGQMAGFDASRTATRSKVARDDEAIASKSKERTPYLPPPPEDFPESEPLFELSSDSSLHLSSASPHRV